MKTIVALYDEIDTARNVVAELVEAGFDRSDISLVSRNFDADVTAEVETTPVDETAEGAAVGALSGGMVGGLAGLLVGLGALAIPGIGPIVAAGPIFTALTGAGIGAATGGVLGALVGLGVPEEHAEYYAEGIRRGGTLVAVDADESWVNVAEEVINRHHPIDVERRSGYWRDSGWEGFNAENDVYTRADYQSDLDQRQAYDRDFYNYVPAFRSHFDTNYGGSSYLYSDYEPIYYFGYRLATEDNYQGYDEWDGLEVEAREEWNQAENTLGRAWNDVKDTVRHAWESVKDALDGDDDDDTYSFGSGNGSFAGNGYPHYTRDFRDHYNTNYAGSGNFFDFYEPGYRYGYYLATDDKYDRYSTWDELEAEARDEWRDTGNAVEHAWEDIKDAAQHAWEVVTEPFDDDDDYMDRSY